MDGKAMHPEERTYNQLTELLLLAGYDASDYPDYVKIPSGQTGDDPLDNPYGGFEYQGAYVRQASYQTGCGLYVKGERCFRDLCYMGVQWCFENDNAVTQCPFHKGHCKDNHPLLRDAPNPHAFCACHQAGTYQYGQSIEKARKEQEAVKEEKYLEMERKYKGRICRSHMRYDVKEASWTFAYDPLACAKTCSFSYCPVRGRALSKKRGNVFYDLKVSTLRKDGTFFSGEPVVAVIKGKRFFERPVSMDICEAAAKVAGDAIYYKEWWNGFSMQKCYDPDLEIEVLNIRACQKECRDLEQDLKDIQSGIHIVHESDRKEAEKTAKRERKSRRLKRLANKIQKKGYGSLSDAEKRLAEKRLDPGDIRQWERERRKRQEEQGEQLVLDMPELQVKEAQDNGA